MREIKFRAYLKDSKQVVEVRHISFFKGETVVKVYDEPMGIEVWFDLEDLEFLQYTGLKDKNDIEIYEGDIVSMIVFEDNAEYLGDVVFKNGCFCLNISLDGTKYKVPALEWKETETIITVIGNIYENPELLERETE